MAVFMSLSMSLIISFVLTMTHMGFTIEALAAWPTSWIESWIVALPVAIILLPHARKLALFLTTDKA